MISPYQRGRICHSKVTHRRRSPRLGGFWSQAPLAEISYSCFIISYSHFLPLKQPPHRVPRRYSMNTAPSTPRTMPTRRNTVLPLIEAPLPTSSASLVTTRQSTQSMISLSSQILSVFMAKCQVLRTILRSNSPTRRP